LQRRRPARLLPHRENGLKRGIEGRRKEAEGGDDPGKGGGIMRFAYVLIKAVSGKIREVADRLAEMEEVSEVHSVSGPYDLLAKLRVGSYEELGQVVPERIQKIEGIRETNTFLVFSVFK
jgi:DNA-binding Lrp family transcriptional regulator